VNDHHSSHKRRHALRPRSVTGLLLASFALVALPLLAAALYSITYVERLADQSQRLVLSGVQVNRVSRELDSILVDMERTARQYRIVETPMLLERFRKQKKAFDATLETLRKLRVGSMPSWNLDKLRERVDLVAQAMQQGPEALDEVLPQFENMYKETGLIIEQGDVFIDAELKQMQDTAQQERRFLFMSMFMLLPGVILLAIVFTVVIARPLRQITSAVARLGKGDFSQPIRIAAPSAELDALGSRLDWMRQQLASLEDERNQFLRHMSHELKTPLASIHEGSDLLRDGTVGALGPQQKEVADIIQRNSQELLSLIENLLDFAAWKNQQVKLEYSHFELETLIKTIVQRQKLTIDGKQLSVSMPAQPLMLCADHDRVYLIVDNLLSNAIKFSPTGGTIRITAEQDRRALHLAVCDQGPGIAPHEREHIFNPFYQGSTGSQAPIQGTGIGLSVVRECVQAHGGGIAITAAAGGGTCFQITLPNQRDDSHAHR